MSFPPWDAPEDQLRAGAAPGREPGDMQVPRQCDFGARRTVRTLLSLHVTGGDNGQHEFPKEGA